MKKISVIHHIGILTLMLIIAPIVYLLLQVFHESEIALKSNLLWEYSKNTMLMVLIVGAVTSFMGVLSAWVVSFYDFPLRRFFKLLLALPLAIPPYIAAHAYADFTYHGGLLYKLLQSFGINKYFDMMNLGGAIFIYCITLYPYVYLMCLSFYQRFSSSLVDNARVLGANPIKLFLKVGLPMARLPVVSGVTLAIMELVSDFGVVDYYGVQAFSTGIYKTWHNYEDFYGAIKLSSVLLVIIFSFVIFESSLRKKLRFFTSTKTGIATLIPTGKRGRASIYLFLASTLVICLGVPIFQLFYNAHYVYDKVIDAKLTSVILTTLMYCSISSVICVIVSFVIANLTAFSENRRTTLISRFATMGYSVPGVIIGLAVIFTFIDLDKFLVPLYRLIGIENKVMVLSTSVFALVFAYVVRFLAVSYNNVYSGYKKINPNLFKAGLTLGESRWRIFWRVDFPLMFPTLLSAFLLVFLEIIKELPITLMLKPYHVETLTGMIYTYIHNEQYSEASVPGLVIVGLGMIAIFITMLYREKKRVKS